MSSNINLLERTINFGADLEATLPERAIEIPVDIDLRIATIEYPSANQITIELSPIIKIKSSSTILTRSPKLNKKV